MAAANYAHCDARKCLRRSTKAFYVGEEDLPDDVKVYHKECIEAESKILTLPQERELFRLLADPIKHYFMENGLEELQAGVMSANIAQRQFDNLVARVKTP